MVTHIDNVATVYLKIYQKKIEERKPDIIVFGYKKVCNDISLGSYIPMGNADTVIQLMKDEAFNICAWDKAVKREILVNHNIEFKKGVYSEDMEWCARIFRYANSCAVIKRDGYAYRQRSNSISKNISKKNIKDIVDNYSICLLQRENLSSEKLAVYDKYLAKNLSMLIIAMSMCTDSLDENYGLFIKNNMKVLKSGRRREKLIYKSIKIFGLNRTVFFLKKIKEIKNI